MTARAVFAPRVTGGQPIELVNALFLVDAQRWRLRYACSDCAYARRDGRCTLGFPNDRMREVPFAAVDSKGVPQFCKAFEADEG